MILLDNLFCNDSTTKAVFERSCKYEWSSIFVWFYPNVYFCMILLDNLFCNDSATDAVFERFCKWWSSIFVWFYQNVYFGTMLLDNLFSYDFTKMSIFARYYLTIDFVMKLHKVWSMSQGGRVLKFQNMLLSPRSGPGRPRPLLTWYGSA